MDAFQHVLESTMELDAIEREKWLGVVIIKSQQDNVYLNALVHPNKPPE